MKFYYTKERKKKLFPNIKDWTKPPAYYLKGKSVKQMTYKEWFWLDPSGFNLIAYGQDIIGGLIFTLGAAYFIKIGALILGLFISIGAVFYLVSFIKRISKRKAYALMTFYDLYLKE